MTPIDLTLANVEWVAGEKPLNCGPGELYATHSGVLDLMGHKLKCYRLNDGRAVFDVDDFNAFCDTRRGGCGT